MAKRRNKNKESMEITDKMKEVFGETENVDGQPSIEVTITSAEVKDEESVEITEETYAEVAVEGKEPATESELINELVTVVENAKSATPEPKELRKAEPEVVAKSKENQVKAKAAKVIIKDNPFGKKVTPEIYKVKHSKNEELMTDFDLMDNIGLL